MLRARLCLHKLGNLTVIGAVFSSAENKQVCFERICGEVMKISKTAVANVDKRLPAVVDEDVDGVWDGAECVEMCARVRFFGVFSTGFCDLA